MSNLSLWQQTNPVGAGNTLVMALYKASAPTVLVASYQLPGPYTGQTQLYTFTGLINVVYNYVLYESPDGGADGTSRNSFSVQPNKNAYNVRDLLYLMADISPFFASGTNFYGQDSSLIGWNWYIERIGQDTQQFGVQWTKTVAGVPTTIDDTTADGWKLLISGDLVGVNEHFVIHFYPQLAASSSPQASAMISQTTLLTSTITLTSSAAGQAFKLEGGGGYFQVNLPDIGTVPDSEPIFFNSAGGSHVNAGISCFSGQSFEWYTNATNLGLGTRANIIYLGQGENVWIYRFTYPGGQKRWIVYGDTAGLRGVGETVYDYSKIPLNAVLANGQLLSRTSYARLWAWVQTLEAGVLISDSIYNNTISYDGVAYKINFGRYSLGDGSTTFRVPTLGIGTILQGNGAGFLRFVNGLSRFPGDFQVDTMQAHQHDSVGNGNNSPFDPWGQGPVKQEGGWNGIVNVKSSLSSPAGLIIAGSFTASTKTTYEGQPQNNGCYGLIRC